MSKVLVADTQDIIFSGLMHLLDGHPEYKVGGRVTEGSKLPEMVGQTSAELLIIDYDLIPFSEADCRQLLLTYPGLKIVIFTNSQDHVKTLNILQAGVHAFLSKNCGSNEITYALQMVASGQKFFCSSVLDLLTQSPAKEKKASDRIQFSSRELQILELIAQDLSTQEIAEKLMLSPHTIHAHRKKILRKMDVSSPIGLIKKALEGGLLRVHKGQILLQ
jgi:DNA-binding NarL/FixJ family response regulator